MAEAFKDLINERSIRALADDLQRAAGDFPTEDFVGRCTAGLDELELKERVRKVAAELYRLLPDDWNDALRLMVAALGPALPGAEKVSSGTRFWPLLQVVEDHGGQDPPASLQALHAMTQRFSAEFAIRPLIEADPAGVLSVLRTWAHDPNLHVRRLVSEGTRPRLPWGRRLSRFVADPAPTLELLELLKDDPEGYVRRSVANHLNDVAKDHPELVVTIARRWWVGAGAERRKLVKHALRTLLKAGDPGALEVLGFGPPQLESGPLELERARVLYGSELAFSIDLRSVKPSDQALMVDYAIHFPRKNGSLSAKVFKGGTRTLEPGGTWSFSKRHPLKRVTTRKHYGGRHFVEILANGRCLARAAFELVGGDG
jgi:3-methyladenine DNA glycosylase AlkC